MSAILAPAERQNTVNIQRCAMTFGLQERAIRHAMHQRVEACLGEFGSSLAPSLPPGSIPQPATRSDTFSRAGCIFFGSHRQQGRTSLDLIHRLLAYGGAVATAGGIAWSLALVVSGRPAGSGFVRYQAAVVSVFIVGAASGALMMLGGSRPAEALHLLYAVIAVAIIPLARSFLGRINDKRAAALLLVAFVVLGAVTYRLFTTGGP